MTQRDEMTDNYWKYQAERWKDICKRAGICMSCVTGDLSEPCTDCLGTGWDTGAPSGYISEKKATARLNEALAGGIILAEELAKYRAAALCVCCGKPAIGKCEGAK